MEMPFVPSEMPTPPKAAIETKQNNAKQSKATLIMHAKTGYERNAAKSSQKLQSENNSNHAGHGSRIQQVSRQRPKDGTANRSRNQTFANISPAARSLAHRPIRGPPPTGRSA